MTNNWNWQYPYSQPEESQLTQQIAQLKQTVSRLSERLDQTQRQLEEIRAKAPLHIEYHFDQLKVNELKGTLNVGLSPQGVQGINSFETPLGNWPTAGGSVAAAADERQIEEMRQQMENYMDLEAPGVLIGMEQQVGVHLNEAHRQRLLADVKGQLRDRVHYYARLSNYPAAGTDEEQQVWQQSIADRTTRDIHTALLQYLENGRTKMNSQQGGGST